MEGKGIKSWGGGGSQVCCQPARRHCHRGGGDQGARWGLKVWSLIKLWSLQKSNVQYLLSLWSAGFWTALGGKKDYQTSKTLQKVVKPPRLFACSNKTGRLIVSILKGRNLFYLVYSCLPTSFTFFIQYLGRRGAQWVHTTGPGTWWCHDPGHLRSGMLPSLLMKLLISFSWLPYP